jgi:hypothetical protein
MDANVTAREARISRRRLLIKAGWVVPVIVGLTLPRNAFAQYGLLDGLPLGKGKGRKKGKRG